MVTNPGVSTPFVMSAVVSNPDSISTSRVFQAVRYAVWLNPSEVNRLVPEGQTVVMKAQLENSATTSPIHKKGVPIELTQLVLGERGAKRGPAIIDGTKLSKGVAISYTNNMGTATLPCAGLQPDGPVQSSDMVSSLRLFATLVFVRVT